MDKYDLNYVKSMVKNYFYQLEMNQFEYLNRGFKTINDALKEINRSLKAIDERLRRIEENDSKRI